MYGEMELTGSIDGESIDKTSDLRVFFGDGRVKSISSRLDLREDWVEEVFPGAEMVSLIVRLKVLGGGSGGTMSIAFS